MASDRCPRTCGLSLAAIVRNTVFSGYVVATWQCKRGREPNQQASAPNRPNALMQSYQNVRCDSDTFKPDVEMFVELASASNRALQNPIAPLIRGKRLRRDSMSRCQLMAKREATLSGRNLSQCIPFTALPFPHLTPGNGGIGPNYGAGEDPNNPDNEQLAHLHAPPALPIPDKWDTIPYPSISHTAKRGETRWAIPRLVQSAHKISRQESPFTLTCWPLDPPVPIST